MGDEVQDFFKTAVEVAKEAGERLKADFFKNKKIEMKENFADLVTETDKAVEDLIMSRFSSKYPSHKFIGEETVSAGGKCELTDDPTWIIDPIDGTTNFVHNIAQTCISIGLAINKEIVLGIVYAPIRNDMFRAIKGQGAFLNDERLCVSKETALSKCAIIVEGGTSRFPEILTTKIQNLKACVENCHGIRAYGSAALDMCFVAQGNHEAYVEHGIHVWDIAAGKIIVEEAGGVVLDPSGGPLDLMNRRVLAACNESVAKQLSKIIENITMERD